MPGREAGGQPALVLLHGWGFTPRVWEPILEPLSPSFRIYNLALPGHDGERSGGLEPDEPVLLAKRLLERAPQRAIWLGWSLGGMAALQAALLHGDRFRALVLVGATPRFVSDGQWRAGIAPGTLREFGCDLRRDYARTMRRFLLLQAGDTGRGRALARRLSARLAQGPTPSRRGLEAGLAVLEKTDLRPHLWRVDVPTWVVHGRSDRLVPSSAGAYLAQHIPGAQLELLSCGHAPFLSHPARFVRILESVRNDTDGGLDALSA